MAGAELPTPAYLDVIRTSDGRYCVTFTRGEFARRSYTPSLDQVIVQARRAGIIAVRTDDLALRQRCQEADIPLVNLRAEEV
jgi:rRNA-processing protein FCF1